MDRQELKRIIKSFGDEWYYYYDFDGIEVCKKLKNDQTSGMYNWDDKLRDLICEACDYLELDDVDNNDPCVFDVGCNMGLYDHEMTKHHIKVYGADRNIEIAKFFKRYITENTDEEWKVELMEFDITTDEVHLPDVDIITMFCVLYHFAIPVEDVFAKLPVMFPNHEYIFLQGNKPRVKKKKQRIAGVKGMVELLEKFGYTANVFEWDGYQKPLVIGRRSL